MRWLNCLLSVLCRALLDKHSWCPVWICPSNEDWIGGQKRLRLDIVCPEGRHPLKLPRCRELHSLTAKKLCGRHCLRYLNTLLIRLVALIRDRLGDSLLLLCIRTLGNFLKNLLASQLLLSIGLCRSRLVLHVRKNLLVSLLILLLNVQIDRTEEYRLWLARRYRGQCICTETRLAAARDDRLATG